MKIRFYPSPVGYVDQIIIDVGSYEKKWLTQVTLRFFPLKCWSWCWSIKPSKISRAWYVETPSMIIEYRPVIYRVKHIEDSIAQTKPSNHA